MQVAFGSGILWGTPLTDANGAAVANPTPVQFGALQDVSVDFSADIKTLFGPNAYPLLAARGKSKISGKAKAAQINGALLNSLYFGYVTTAGIRADVFDTTGANIPTTPFQITPTPPSSGTWAQDLGVRNANAVPLTRVASAPTTGQYSVSAGVYTFAAADVGTTVYISYQYTATSTTAPKIAISNVVMGAAPTFRADLSVPYGGKTLTIVLFNCVANKLSLATKLDDFTIPEFDFEAFADSSGVNVGSINLSE
jgi:hypothetical protein